MQLRILSRLVQIAVMGLLALQMLSSGVASAQGPDAFVRHFSAGEKGEVLANKIMAAIRDESSHGLLYIQPHELEIFRVPGAHALVEREG